MPGMGGRSATKKRPKGRKGKNGKRKASKRGGGMPGMPKMPGMPGMPGGMPDPKELEKLQQQLPAGMQGMDLNKLDFNEAMKRMQKGKFF